VDLANTTIRAPVDGVVISRSVDVGQTVAASLQAPKLFVIANNLSEMQVETRIDEADIGRIHPGLPVTFTVDAFPDRTFDGRVAQVRLEPIIDQNVVTYTTVIRTRNPELRLRPGMTANVAVMVASRDSVLKVPNMALRFRPAEGAGARGGGAGGGRMAGGAGAMGSGTAAASTRESMGGSAGAAAGTGRGGARGVTGRPGGGGAAWTGRGGPSAGGAPGGGAWTGRGGAGDPAGGGRGAWAGRGGAGMRGGAASDPGGGTMPDLDRAMVESANEAIGVLKPGRVYVLRDGKPTPIMVMTGLTDGVATEIHSGDLKPGDQVITALEQSTRGPQLQPPPGMGGRPGGRR
jgi:HlyD family secretion protein